MQQRRNAARKAAKLQWLAEQYRQQASLGGSFKKRALRMANILEDFAAATLCRDLQRAPEPVSDGYVH